MVRRSLALVALGALGAAGCSPCESGLPVALYDDLQRRCGELPCGWSVEAGEARSTPTIHAAELGMALAAGARLRLDVDGAVALEAESDGDAIYLMAGCSAGTGLAGTLTLTASDGSAWLLEGDIPPQQARIVDGVIGLSLMPLLPTGAEVRPAGAVEAITLEVVGPGRCIIDEVRLLAGRLDSCY